MPLDDTMLQNLKSDGTPAKLADAKGLELCVSASGENSGGTSGAGLPFWRQAKDTHFRRVTRRISERKGHGTPCCSPSRRARLAY